MYYFQTKSSTSDIIRAVIAFMVIIVSGLLSVQMYTNWQTIEKIMLVMN